MEKIKFAVITEHTVQVSPYDYSLKRYSLEFEESTTLKEVKEALIKQMTGDGLPERFYAHINEIINPIK